MPKFKNLHVNGTTYGVKDETARTAASNAQSTANAAQNTANTIASNYIPKSGVVSGIATYTTGSNNISFMSNNDMTMIASDDMTVSGDKTAVVASHGKLTLNGFAGVDVEADIAGVSIDGAGVEIGRTRASSVKIGKSTANMTVDASTYTQTASSITASTTGAVDVAADGNMYLDSFADMAVGANAANIAVGNNSSDVAVSGTSFTYNNYDVLTTKPYTKIADVTAAGTETQFTYSGNYTKVAIKIEIPPVTTSLNINVQINGTNMGFFTSNAAATRYGMFKAYVENGLLFSYFQATATAASYGAVNTFNHAGNVQEVSAITAIRIYATSFPANTHIWVYAL